MDTSTSITSTVTHTETHRTARKCSQWSSSLFIMVTATFPKSILSAYHWGVLRHRPASQLHRRLSEVVKVSSSLYDQGTIWSQNNSASDFFPRMSKLLIPLLYRTSPWEWKLNWWCSFQWWKIYLNLMHVPGAHSATFRRIFQRGNIPDSYLFLRKPKRSLQVWKCRAPAGLVSCSGEKALLWVDLKYSWIFF